MAVDLVNTAAGALLQRRYRLQSRIASGGMGSVYRAWDDRLDRAVAIKVLHTHHAEDARVRARFRAEARHAARVRHPNVVSVIDQDDVDGVPFIVMELIDGPSLRDVLTRRAPLPPAEVAMLLASACAGLTAVHDAGIVHRDVKPENLLIDGRGTVRVADFGIARALDTPRFTPTGELLGSVEYIAPEVVLGHDATAASDQYALGIVAFEALTGRTPLPAGERVAIAVRHAREDVPSPSTLRPGLDAALDTAVTRATARDPRARHASLHDFVDAVGRAVRPATPVATAADGPTSTYDASRPAHAHAVGGTPAAGCAHAAGGAPARPRRATRALSVPHHHTRPERHPAARGPSAIAVPPRRRRTSAIAVLALLISPLSVGAFVAPIVGYIALRRIDRSGGRLRGGVIASVAVLVGVVRLGALLAGVVLP
jgi:serine/threonine-protein kinase